MARASSRRWRHGRRRGGKVYRAIVSGAKTDRAPLRQGLARLTAGDVLLGTRLDRLARSTRDLRNTLAVMTGRGAGGTSLVMPGHHHNGRVIMRAL